MAASKSNEDVSAAGGEMSAPADQKVTLEEFCTRLSKADNRVELIGGFHHSEAAAGHIKDVEGEFQNRFHAFVNKPV